MNVYTRFDEFLEESLDGFDGLEIVEVGDHLIEHLLNNPHMYQLNHISSYLNVWDDDEVIVISFTGSSVSGIHFCFLPLDRETMTKGLRYIEGQWI